MDNLSEDQVKDVRYFLRESAAFTRELERLTERCDAMYNTSQSLKRMNMEQTKRYEQLQIMVKSLEETILDKHRAVLAEIGHCHGMFTDLETRIRSMQRQQEEQEEQQMPSAPDVDSVYGNKSYIFFLAFGGSSGFLNKVLIGKGRSSSSPGAAFLNMMMQKERKIAFQNICQYNKIYRPEEPPRVFFYYPNPKIPTDLITGPIPYGLIESVLKDKD